MGHIRPLVEEDLPAVIELHHKAFGSLRGYPPEAVRSSYSALFFRHPWADGTASSLIYEADDKRVTGFLGCLQRPMRMGGKTIRMAISNNFMVDPAKRSTLAALELLRAFFAGPQDLSIASEGNLVSRRIWESFGGTVAYGYSMQWFFALQPCRFVVSALRERGLPRVLASMLRPIAGLVDGGLSRVQRSPLRVAVPRLPGKALDMRTMLDSLPAFTADYHLEPEYDQASLAWLLQRASRRGDLGDLRMRAVDDGQKGIVGWYLYYMGRGGRAQVLQIAAHPGSRQEVLDHLLDDARRNGAVAISGQVEPRWLSVLSQRSCLFTQRGFWMLVHARDPELVRVFQRGDAFLSRLEGEWWIGV